MLQNMEHVCVFFGKKHARPSEALEKAGAQTLQPIIRGRVSGVQLKIRCYVTERRLIFSGNDSLDRVTDVADELRSVVLDTDQQLMVDRHHVALLLRVWFAEESVKRRG